MQLIKTIFHTLFLGFMVAVITNGSVLAQSSPDNLGEDGACPSDEALKKLKGVKLANKGLGYSFIVESNAEIFVGPEGGADDILDKYFDLFSKVRIYKGDEETERVLIANQKRTLCGWISRDVLLGVQTPEKMVTKASKMKKKCSGNSLFKRLSKGKRGLKSGPPQVEERCAPEIWWKKNSPLKLRAVIHNLSVKGNSEIPLYAVPGSKKRVGSWKQFEIFDIFATARIGRSPKPENKRHGHYVLVGSSTSTGKKVVGWVHEDDVYIWSARMATYWAGTGKAVGTLNGQSVLLEPERMTTAGMKILPRYPVTGSNPTPKRLNEKIKDEEFEAKEALDHVKLFKVVAPGQYCRVDNGSDCIDSEQYESIMAKVHNQVERFKRVDVVFLIDGTTSMEPYFSSVTNAVVKLSGSYANDEKRDLRVGAVLYGDYNANEPTINSIGYDPVVPLHDPSESRDINKLSSKKADMPDRHKDLLEAPLGAIVKLANEDQDGKWWRSDSGLKLIVHIADHGNRLPGERGVYINTSEGKKPLALGIDEKGTWQDVAGMLRSKKIFYAPIAVRGKYRAEANIRFIDQAKSISKFLANRGDDKTPLSLPLVESLSKNNREVEEDIYTRLKDILDQQNKYVETFLFLRECTGSGLDQDQCRKMMKNKGGQGGGNAARFAREEIIREALGKKADNILGRQQTVLQVDVKPRQTGRDLLTYWMMVHEKDWEGLREAFSQTCNQFSEKNYSSKGYRELRDSLATIAGALTGSMGDDEDDDLETVGSLLKKIAYIFPGLTPDPKQLGEEFDDIEEEDRKRWHKNLCRISAWFKRIDNNQTVGSGTQAKPYDMGKLVWDEEREKWQADEGTQREYDWRHTYNNGMRFYFIPVEFLSFSEE